MSFKFKTTKIEGVSSIYGASIVSFHIVKDKKVVFKNTTCMDYIQDEYFYSANGKKDLNLPFDKPRLLITIPDKYKDKYDETVENMLDFVNQVAAELKIKPITIYKIKDCVDKYLVVGNEEFLRGSPMLSLLMKLLRIGNKHIKGQDYKTTIQNIINKKIDPDYYADKDYLEKANVVLNYFIKIGYRKFFRDNIIDNWVNNKHLASSHASGIVGLYNALKNPAGYKHHVLDLYQIRQEILEEIKSLKEDKE